MITIDLLLMIKCGLFLAAIWGVCYVLSWLDWVRSYPDSWHYHSHYAWIAWTWKELTKARELP